MNSNKLILLIPVIVVFAAGLAVGSWSTNLVPNQGGLASKKPILTTTPARSHADTLQAEHEVIQPSEPQPGSVIAQSEDPTEGVREIEFSSNIESLLAQLDDSQNGIYTKGNYAKAIRVFEDYPYLVDQLIELIAVTDPNTSVPGMSVATRLLSTNQTFNSKVFERLRTGDQPSVWLGHLRGSLPMKKDDIFYISDLLPRLQSDGGISSALLTLGQQRPDTARMNFDERARIAQRIQKYQSSENPVLRTVAIQSLYNYPTDSMEQDLVVALDDSDFGVRNAVTQLIGEKSIGSQVIKDKMLTMASSNNVNMDERVMISTGLLRMNLTVNERNTIMNLREQLTRQLNAMSQEERIAMMSELTRK